VHAGSPPDANVALFGALFAARTDVHAVRWENTRTGGRDGCLRGGWCKGVPHAEREYLPLTAEVLELSRSGTGAHTWIFFTAPVAAETARRLGTGLLREAMALRGQMSLASYDRLFPSPGRVARRWGREPDRRPAARQGAEEQHHGVPGPGHPGAA
jgi:hypothetical protein